MSTVLPNRLAMWLGNRLSMGLQIHHGLSHLQLKAPGP
uniref:(California timema) hypothetical protein n=1 Tax=Timema californicum TaxID=61474 RepID=A0A7R9JDG5_TIMCA|nr:unnamed protein product [Timema californicum]